MWRNQNFLGKLLILARPREYILHTASFFKSTKRKFPSLTR